MIYYFRYFSGQIGYYRAINENRNYTVEITNYV